MRAAGRFAQLLGLSLGQMLVMLVSAVCCFAIGRIVEGFAGP
jgi:hypothetical protein